MPTFTFPSPLELKQVEQDLLPVLTQDDPVFDEFPLVEVNAHRLRWEQMDNYTGLQSVRGMNGQPGRVNRVGAKAYDMEPGVYGDFTVIDEKELTERRALGQFDQFVPLNDLVAMAQQHLLVRRFDRIRQVLWAMLTTGTFSVAKPSGEILHTDVFPLQTASAGTAWSNLTASTPIADLRSAVLKYRGRSVDFGRGSKLYVNKGTVNNLLLNTNAADIGRVRTDYGATVNTLANLNAILAANDLPEIVPYDRGYLNEAGTFTLFIPDGKGVIVGRRTNGAKLGEYRMTRNAENPNVEPGPYTRVIDRGELQVPRTVEVHDGHNGGPVVYFPGAVISLSL
jgi:hypothetical protein